MIITISGNPGSGKSTVAKILVKEKNYVRIYAGGVMRNMAREQEITVEKLMELAKTDTKIDIDVDQRVRDEAREHDENGEDVLVEGRVQFYHIPESIKIYVYVDPKVGAERILKDLRDKEAAASRNQEMVDTVEEVMELSEKREAGDAQRYMKLYGVDHREKEHYDYVIDTTTIDAEEAAKKVMNYLEQLQNP